MRHSYAVEGNAGIFRQQLCPFQVIRVTYEDPRFQTEPREYGSPQGNIVVSAPRRVLTHDVCGGNTLAKEILRAGLSLRWFPFPGYSSTYHYYGHNPSIVEINGGVESPFKN